MIQVLLVKCKRTRIIFVAILAREGCFISIKSNWHSESRFVLNLRSRNPICSFNAKKRLAFPIGGGRVENSFFREVWKECIAHIRESSSDDSGEALMRMCLSQIRTVLKHSYRSVPSEYVELVRGYSAGVRFDLYKLIMRKVGGEVFRLLLNQKSGIVFFVLLLEYLKCQEPLAVLVDGFKRSEKLKPVLKKATCLYFKKRFHEQKKAFENGYGYWIMQNQSEMDKIAVQYNLLLSKAGRLVDPKSLEYPPIFPLVAEDIPEDVVQNRSWFRVFRYLNSWAFDEVVKNKEDTMIIEGVVSCCLKNWGKTEYLLNSNGSVVLESMFSICKLKKKVLTRKSNLESVLKGLFFSKVNGMASQFGGSCLFDSKGIDLDRHDLEFPQLFLGYLQNNVEIRPILNVRQLIEEGMRMRHCVANFVNEAYFGEKYYFSVRIQGQNLTLEIEKKISEHGYRISQLYGVENRKCSNYEFETVKRWLDEARAINNSFVDRELKPALGWESEYGAMECVYDLLGPYYPMSKVRRVNVIV